ncbi:MAG: hypothetical protein VYD19_07665 [Myxococcota bacterium]|nr:hypothetical protein [Myxococcota bacterium]
MSPFTPLLRSVSVWVSLSALLSFGCEQRVAPLEPLSVTRVSPRVPKPGETLRIYGVAFGESSGFVSLSGRSLAAQRWGNDQIEVNLPRDLRGGRQLLVVARGDERGPPFPVEVFGAGVSISPSPSPLPDRGPPASDQRPDQRDLRDLYRVDVIDSGGEVEVSLRPTLEAGELQVELQNNMLDLSGIAGQLRYQGPIEFARAFPENQDRIHLEETHPGQLLFFQVNPSAAVIRTLFFRVTGPGEVRFSFPARYRALRDLENQEREGRWATLRLQISNL